MEDLNNLDLLTLVDMLAKHTNEYMKMMKDGTSEEEYTRCKTMIQNLTAEIAYRKQKSIKGKTTKTTRDLNLK
jgi:hypothetical protein